MKPGAWTRRPNEVPMSATRMRDMGPPEGSRHRAQARDPPSTSTCARVLACALRHHSWNTAAPLHSPPGGPMRDPRTRSLARLIVNHSCRLQSGEAVLIESFDLTNG